MHDNNDRTIIHDLGAVLHSAFHDNNVAPPTVHHHHGPIPNDILIHSHDYDHGADNDHLVTAYDSHGKYQAFFYGSADHDHERDDHPSGAIIDSASNDHIVDPAVNPVTAANDPDIDWADDIDTLTGNNPYNL